MTVRFVIIGGGPAGNTAATVAATLGAQVTLIERDHANWQCSRGIRELRKIRHRVRCLTRPIPVRPLHFEALGKKGTKIRAAS